MGLCRGDKLSFVVYQKILEVKGVNGQHLKLVQSLTYWVFFFPGCGYCSYKSDNHFGTEEPRRV